MKTRYFLFVLLAFFLTSCTKNHADLLVYNARIYTVDSLYPNAEAFVIKDGKFLDVGTNNEIRDKYTADEEKDAGDKSIFPGLIDAHCHFYAYGLYQDNVDVTGTKSFKEVVEKVIAFARNNKEGWIVGRGWDQNDWPEKTFPVKDTFDVLFPDRPLYLSRVDGHAALVNQSALNLAKYDSSTRITGGLILLDSITHQPTGVLLDNAADKLRNVIGKPTKAQQVKALRKAQEDCFSVGLTTVSDAGLDKETILLMDSMQKDSILKMRIYAMLNPTEENLETFLTKGIYVTERINVRSFKIYADGALGSRGACLLHPYADKPDTHGFLLNDLAYYIEMAEKLILSDFQMNTHCIGDSANRYLLQVYGDVLKMHNDRRWRIEHAQIVDPSDFLYFKKYSIIPSVQPTHATSDMYWAKERLGKHRMNGAYAYKQLLKNASILAAGSDFPVEGINPLMGFYAAVSRQDVKGYPKEGFRIEEAITREEALRSMTIWAAYANFEDKLKGSIEKGKVADFVILDKDIMKVDLKELTTVKVLSTYINGEEVYKKQ